jgi:hypothetical protein
MIIDPSIEGERLPTRWPGIAGGGHGGSHIGSDRELEVEFPKESVAVTLTFLLPP